MKELKKNGTSIQMENGESPDYRYVYVGQPEWNQSKQYCSNFIVTSKYTVFSFLPKFLFETFRKIANTYFLVISVMQCIPKISNTNGLPSTLPTLMFIVSIDALFAILEDAKRHQADATANARVAHVLDEQTGQVVDKTWAEVVVGDKLQVFNREGIPADLVIIAVHETGPPTGICYVETKSLDGETNLKLRQAMDSTFEVYTTLKAFQELKGTIQCEKPNIAINRFTGTFEIEKSTNLVQGEPIPPKSILLRGCILRNTEWVYGVVVNTGADTKIMMSSTETPSKISSMDRSINRYIISLVLVLALCCIVGATGSTLWDHQHANDWYFHWNPNLVEEWIVMFLYFFLLMYQFVPISLYVSMSMVKYIQAQFMQWDTKMYNVETNLPAAVRTMNLNEELGQVSYVFSDKTGTLTCNVMEFRKCSINGISYGKGTTEIGLAAMKRSGCAIPSSMLLDSPTCKKAPYVNFDGDEIYADLNGQSGQVQKTRIEDFFTHLAVCHTVIPEKQEGTGNIILSASSPDEQALVAGAKFFGFNFVGRAPGMACVEIQGKQQQFEILDVLEFNSTRKRMSVVARTHPQGQLRLYTKGADCVIYNRLCKTLNSTDIQNHSIKHMENFAADGLRTLAIAMKDLSEAYYLDWSTRYRASCSCLEDIEKRKAGLENRIDKCMEEIERDLILLGATAIEDKLQHGVPSTIANLANAGIVIWVLTGDKEETAINIGFACQLLHNDMRRVVINLDLFKTKQDILNELNIQSQRRGNDVKRYSKLTPDQRNLSSSSSSTCSNSSSSCSNSTHSTTTSPTNLEELALIIDGEALDYALEKDCKEALLTFAQFCKAVIACRVSPAQKAQLVALIRDNVPNVRTLAIGDGANDVSMIQEAHIGIGISGQEGMQAVNASDYAISQFRYLERLVMVHGRWNYQRMSRLVVYMFYKNIMLTSAQYWYTFLAGFSGQKFFLELGVQLYNILYTALPIVLLAVLDQDISDDLTTMFPKLYFPGPRDEGLNNSIFWGWVLGAVVESIGVTLFTTYAIGHTLPRGSDCGVWEIGCIVFTLVVLIVNFKLMLTQNRWSILNYLVFGLSILSWFVTAYISSFSPLLGGSNWNDMAPMVLSTSCFWLLILFVPVALLAFTFFLKGFKIAFQPEYSQLVQEVEKFKLDVSLLEWDDPAATKIPIPFSFDVNSPIVEVVSSNLSSGNSPTAWKKIKTSSIIKVRGFAYSNDPDASITEANMTTYGSRKRLMNPKHKSIKTFHSK